MPQSQPRVLFLTSAAFNRTTGGGITFSNLFAGWPKDALATVHNDPVPVTYETCEHYYRLSEKEIRRWGYLRYIPLGKPATDVTVAPAAEGKRHGLFFRVLKIAKKGIFGDAIPETAELSPELEVWIREFRPTVLYTILGSNAMMELAALIRVRFGLPLVVHIMDDWVSVLYQGGLLSGWQRRKKERLMQHLMNVASMRLSIGDAMAEAYHLRYGQPFLAFQNAIELKRWSRYIKTDTAVGKPVRAAYIGSIFNFAQLESLTDCCRAVQTLADGGMAIQLEIYSPRYLAEQHRELLVQGTAITLHDTLQDDDVFFRTLQEVDILLLPVNFDSYTVAYIRYSMPTKVPAYLAVGTPILAYGPAEVAQVAYAKQAGWALTVTERDLAALKQALHRLATDEDLRRELNARARETAHARHDADAVRTAFQASLIKAAKSRPT